MMVEALQRIVEPFRLTPREFDVVNALVLGHVTARDLARELKISESTAHNYIDRISAKTGFGGKTELLAYIAQKAFQLFDNARFFISTPSVLVIDDDADLADALAAAFRAKGCRSSAAYEARDSLADRIVAERFDLIVCDVGLGKQNGREFLDSLSDRIVMMPTAILISGSEVVAPEAGSYVADLFRKPIDFSRLFERAVDALISVQRDVGRGERAAIAAKVQVNGVTVASTYEISAGGMAISAEALPVAAGTSIRFEIELPEKTIIRGNGETMWSRPSGADDSPARAGIRFKGLEGSEQDYLKDYVHTKNILRFIPIDRELKTIKRRTS